MQTDQHKERNNRVHSIINGRISLEGGKREVQTGRKTQSNGLLAKFPFPFCPGEQRTFSICECKEKYLGKNAGRKQSHDHFLSLIEVANVCRPPDIESLPKYALPTGSICRTSTQHHHTKRLFVVFLAPPSVVSYSFHRASVSTYPIIDELGDPPGQVGGSGFFPLRSSSAAPGLRRPGRPSLSGARNCFP